MANAHVRSIVSTAAKPAKNYVHIESGRVDWVDYLKGFCILLVVMLHSVAGVEKAVGANGWMHVFVEVAQPMRMPAFFMASGLFLMRTIDRPLAVFTDRKIVHFAYFYVLWLTIQFAFKAPGMMSEGGIAAPLTNYALAFVQPFGTLWFIYALPVFFIVTRWLRPVSPPLVIALAALLQVLPIHTPSLLINEFAHYFIWFYAGYAFSGRFFDLAQRASNRPTMMLTASFVIILMTWLATRWQMPLAGWPHWVTSGMDGKVMPFSQMPLVSLLLGMAGIVALVSISAVLASCQQARFIRWCGSHSIVIYLAFFLPMATSRAVLLKLGIISEIGTVSLMVWIAAVIGPIILFWLVEKTGYGLFLFERPQWAKLPAANRSGHEKPTQA